MSYELTINNEARQKRLKSIIENLPDNVFLISQSGTCLDVYEGKNALHPLLTQKKFLGRNVFDVFHKKLALELRAVTKQAFAENATKMITFVVKPEDLLLKTMTLNAPNWYEGRVIPLTLEDSEQRAVMWITRNVTEKKLLENQIKSLLERDYLTGIYNRRTFLLRLSECFSEYQRYGNEISLLMIDFDKFKIWNDKLGHQGGDEIICHVIEVCKRILRSYDVFGRIGGEEFAIILPRIHVNESHELAERLRQTIEMTPCRIDEQEISITVSIGIAQFLATDKNKSEILSRSDKAMYQSKKSGRNQVTQYSEDCFDKASCEKSCL